MSARAAAFALALILASRAAATDCPELAQLTRATRLEPSVTWVTPMLIQIVAGMDDFEGGLSTGEMERIGDLTRDAYSPMALAADVQTELAEHCNAEAVAGANAFYRSPLGVKIVRGGMEVLTQSLRLDQDAYYRKLLEEGVSNGRLESARSIKPATLVFALSARVRFAMLQPVTVVCLQALATAHAQPAPSEDAISQHVAQQSAAMRPYFDTLTDLAQLFSTRDLSEAELQEYRGFLGSRTGVWYREAIQRGFERALEAAGKRLVTSVAQTQS